MAKPYSLLLYSPAAIGSQQFNQSLTKAAIGWKRSKRFNGGCWLGGFTLEGEVYQLNNFYRNYLGYDVQERAGGALSWRGLVYEMDLTLNGITRRRSLDLMANRIKTTFNDMRFSGDNFVGNPGFEEFNVGPPVDFFGWYEDPAGSIVNGAGHAGITSCQLNGNGAENGVYIRQNLTVTPGAVYQFKFWHRGDGGATGQENCGWFGVRNPNAPTNWVVGPQRYFNTTATWDQKVVEFSGPSEGEAMLFFFAPTTAGRITYVDDVEVLEKQETVCDSEWSQIEDAGAGGPQSRYGVKEEIIHLDGYPEATSTAYRTTYLAENGWPWGRPVAASKRRAARLDVQVAGYVWTMNWLYVMAGDGNEHDISNWIQLMLGSTDGRDVLHGGTSLTAGDCQWLRYGNVATNALQAPQLVEAEERPWDVIQELIELGDGTGAVWRGWVDCNLQFHYQPINTNPRYYIRRTGIYNTLTADIPSNHWTMEPAVFRDMTYRPSATEPGSFLQSPQDMYVGEIEMADGWDQPALKTTLFTEAEGLLAESERGVQEDTTRIHFVKI